MTNLTAESVLESAQELIGRELPECVEDFQQALEFVRLQTRIEAMRDCAREHCTLCLGEHMIGTQRGRHRHAINGEAHECDAQYEQREIARLTAELAKLDPATGG